VEPRGSAFSVYEPVPRAASCLINLSISNHHNPRFWCATTPAIAKMGFTFKGLTSSALVSGSAASANADNKDIADVPASYQGHTSMDVARPDEKVGSPRESALSRESDEELNKVDTTAEIGVQQVQAASMIWKKRDLILAYIA
jgi:hypothetical protein